MKKDTVWQQYGAKALALFGIALVLEFAIADISFLLEDRSKRRQEAEADIRRMAGTEQVIEGPVLGIETSKETGSAQTATDSSRKYPQKKVNIFPLKQINVTSKVVTEERYRGIYALETFVSTIQIIAEVVIPPTIGLQSASGYQDSSQVARGLLFFRVSGKQYIQSFSDVTLDGTALILSRSPDPDLVTFEVPLPSMTSSETSHALRATLKVRGTRGIAISPMSQSYDITIESTSPNPRFMGAVLPLERAVDVNGSRASWHGEPVSTSLSCYPECLSVSEFFSVNASPMGVDFLGSLGSHSIVERSIKYRSLVIWLTFGAFILFEIVTKIRIHPIQYLVVGAALTVYYLLLLSLAEQVGFSCAYGAAAFVTIALIAGYSSAILKRRKYGIVIGSLLVSVYGFLYTVLKEQDAALLFGSIGLTLFLAIFMFITRRIDWYELMPTIRPRDEVSGPTGSLEDSHSFALSE